MAISKEDISGRLIAKSIDLFRLNVTERKKAVLLLEKMRKELNAKLASDDITTIGKRRLNELLKESTAIIDEYYSKINTGLSGVLSGLSDHEAEFTSRIFIDAGLSAKVPSQVVMSALVSDLLIQGAPSSAWWARQSETTRFNFAQQVRQGIAQGETNQKIIGRVKGFMVARQKDAAALVQTSIQTVANNARMATFKANSGLITAVKQLSTLDGHTSDVCVAYSGGEWTLDGKPINGTTLPFNSGPPRHFNCRSVLVPITKSFKELGVDIPEPPEGTRASDQGQIPANTTFSEFLDNKSKAYQDDLLGKGRAELWRAGKITLRDLLDQNGRPLTLKELIAKHA